MITTKKFVIWRRFDERMLWNLQTYNKRDFSKPQNKGYVEFCCGNEESDEYGTPTFYDDTCDSWEEKE